MMTSKFQGPLFIVGMPRSGTKLLRDLLNQNPEIAIPTVESHFIPYLIKQFGIPPKFHQQEEIDRFYVEFTRTPFFWNMKNQGRTLEKESLIKAANLTSWASIFEVILKFYAPLGRSSDFIWGDKTPGYLRHMPLLKSLFPEARFLHIVRDPRDYVLSVSKAWGKSIYRAAHVWNETLRVAYPIGLLLGGDYKEVFYEALISEPERVLDEVCQFLNRKFIPGMMKLSSSSETLGDARGQTEIVQDNQGKYAAHLSWQEVKRIEEIVYPIAKSVGYQPEFAARHKPLNPLTLQLLRIYDGWTSVRFHVSEKGFSQGVDYFLSLHRRSSWR